ncbi:hypothetical protein ACFL6Y_07800 [Elusimicrobiota bacterium]
MKKSITLSVGLFFVIVCCGYTNAGGLSVNKSGLTDTAFFKALNNFKARMPDAETKKDLPETSKKKKKKDRNRIENQLDFTVNKSLDRVEIYQGDEVELRAEKRHGSGFNGMTEFDIHGKLFNEEVSYGDPWNFKSHTFGNELRYEFRGADARLYFTEDDFGRLSFDGDLGKTLDARSVVVVLNMINYLKSIRSYITIKGSDPRESHPAQANDFSFEIYRNSNDFMSVHGPDVSLNVYKRQIISNYEYELTGEALGRKFDFGDLMLETDDSFLGPRGYRVNTSGLEIETTDRGSDFGLSVYGTANIDARLALLIITFAQSIR